MLIFFSSRNFEDKINTILIWPIFYKDRYQNKPAIFTLLSLLMFLNYLNFFFYGLNFTLYEVGNNSIKGIKNCFFCTDKENLLNNFSAVHFKFSLIFNISFGGLFGIYLSKKKIFNYNGLYSDNDFKKYLARFGIYILFFTPLIFLTAFNGQGFVTIIASFVIPLTIGILIHTFFF